MTYFINYAETYADTYRVEADSYDEAVFKLSEDIKSGREPGPNNCIYSEYQEAGCED